MAYEIRWAKIGGRFTMSNIYLNRQSAIMFLNHLILDNGITDARIRSIRRN